MNINMTRKVKMKYRRQFLPIIKNVEFLLLGHLLNARDLTFPHQRSHWNIWLGIKIKESCQIEKFTSSSLYINTKGCKKKTR